MNILVTGDRNWEDAALILDTLLKLQRQYKNITIIEGGARGADNIAKHTATLLDIPVIEVPAHWKHTIGCSRDCQQVIGKAAGAIRNRKMFDTYYPELVVAFHCNLLVSRGTKDMVSYSRQQNCPVVLQDGQRAYNSEEIDQLLLMK